MKRRAEAPDSVKFASLRVGDVLQFRSSKPDLALHKIIHLAESRLVYISPKIITVDFFQRSNPRLKHSWDWELIQMYIETVLKPDDCPLLNLLYNFDDNY